MKTTTLCLLAALVAASPLIAVPAVVNYQGYLTDTNGNPLGSGTAVNRKVLFRTYDSANAGTRLWTEEHTVTIAEGRFSVLLGNGIDPTGTASTESRPNINTVFNGVGDRYIGITVDNGDGTFNASDTEIAPRQRITSSVYALRAGIAESVASGSDLSLGTDNGLGYYDSGRQFNGIGVNGPVLYGTGGGALGASNSGTQTTALRWQSNGDVSISNALSSVSLSTSGNASVGGTLGVTGATSLGALGVTGATTLNSLSVTNAATAGSLGVTNQASVGSLSVTGNSTFSGRLDALTGLTSPPGNSASGGNGTRLLLWPGTDGLATPFAIGIDGSTLWNSVPNSAIFNWYGGTTSLMNLNGNTANLSVTGGISSGGDMRLSDAGTLYLRTGTDLNHGLTFNNNSFASQSTDGPVLFGFGGGILGSKNTAGASEAWALKWDSGGNVEVKSGLKAQGKDVPNAEEPLRMIRGTIGGVFLGGVELDQGNGFSAGRYVDGSGNTNYNTYKVTFEQPFSGIPSVTASYIKDGVAFNGDRLFITIYNPTANGFTMVVTTDGGDFAPTAKVSFTAIGPR